MITYNSDVVSKEKISIAVRHAIDTLRRDIRKTCIPSSKEGITIKLESADNIEPECFVIYKKNLESNVDNSNDKDKAGLIINATDDLGFIYGIYYVSKEILGVNEFWFWNEQKFIPKDGYIISDNYKYESKPFAVKYRGWFINDEVLIDTWKINGDKDKPWELAFEALLRCGGNMTIPGTDENAHIYCELASEMGLWITHHHAEPLGAQMFARAYPELDASYDKYPELFEKLWVDAIEKQGRYKVIWNLGFRGQGDRPFWADDPQYDTDEKRGQLMSSLIRKQYDLIKSYDQDAICCSNLYGETMELYKKGFLKLPEDVIYIWADNGFGKMVSRRQGMHNPRVPALPEKGSTGQHGIYYHASFYDLQAAAQMTMMPNSPEFIINELQKVYECGADDFWIINSSNIKPHVYYLELIANMWKFDDKSFDADSYTNTYSRKYYKISSMPHESDSDNTTDIKDQSREYKMVADILKMWPEYSISYGPNEDDHAGEQFTNNGSRVLATALITEFDHTNPKATKSAKEWRWFSDSELLIDQIRDYKVLIEKGVKGYEEYLGKCRNVYNELSGDVKDIFEDTILWQIEYLYNSYHGAYHTCNAIEACLTNKTDSDKPDYIKAFYEGGLAARAFKTGYEEMRITEKGVFKGFFENDCEADIRQSFYVMKGFMSYVRFLGDGPHFYLWQRMFQKGAGGDKVLLILRTRKHVTDEELWQMMDNKYRRIEDI